MARRSIEDRLETERLRREQLDARIRKLQSQQAKHDRVRDTRRKVLLGALLLERLNADRDAESPDPEFARRLSDWLRRELPGFLTRDVDKKLFPEFIAVNNDDQTKDSGEVTPASGNDQIVETTSTPNAKDNGEIHSPEGPLP